MRASKIATAFLTVFGALTFSTTSVSDAFHEKPDSEMTPMTMYDSIAACAKVQRSDEPSVNCVVTYVQGHPALAVEFANEPSMNTYLGDFLEQVASPFCEAATRDQEDAYLVVALRKPRLGSVSPCEAGPSSDWISLDTLGQS